MLFVDNKTKLVYSSFQESKTASEACRSKCDYETLAKSYNVEVESYHADNGAFCKETLNHEIDSKIQKQLIKFCGQGSIPSYCTDCISYCPVSIVYIHM
jgi:hypothetical protein